MKIQGIEKPMLLSLLKKIEIKPSVSSGQYTQRVRDLKIKTDLTDDLTTPKGLNFHRTKKNLKVK